MITCVTNTKLSAEQIGHELVVRDRAGNMLW